jgi:hypothetical protein
VSWKGVDLRKLKDLQENLERMRALVQAQKVKELEKLEKVIGVFDSKTQDEIRDALDAGKMD